MPYFLHVEAHTPRGRFSGVINATPSDRSTLEQLRDTLQNGKLASLVLYSPAPSTAAGPDAIEEIALTEGVLAESVLVYQLRKAP